MRDLVAAHRLLGLIAFERGHLQECAAHLKLTLAERDSDTEALLWLGLCYLYAGQIEATRPIAARLMGVDPLSSTTWILESTLCWFAGELAAGIAPMNRCIELGGTGTIMRWMRGYALALNGRLDEARADADCILQSDESNPYSRQLASLTRALGGDVAGAREVLRPLDGPCSTITCRFTWPRATRRLATATGR